MKLPDEVIRAIDKVRECDDRLGRYSDYEGNQDGSTFHFWQKGPEEFASQVERAIRDHRAAIAAWTDLAMLNHRYMDRALGERREGGA